MTFEPEFLELEDVLEFHEELLALHGGETGVRDLGLLESALAQPRAMFGGEYLHGDLFLMAAAYAFHIAENQPFVDGNKRTALVTALTFLELNGFSVDALSDRLYLAMLAVGDGRLDKAGLALLLRELAPRP
jgi:death-on-curing protein